MAKTRMVLIVLTVLLTIMAIPALATDPAADAADAKLVSQYESLSPDQLADAMFTEMEQMTDLLAGITDVESAQKALPALEKIGDRLKLMGAVGEKMEAGLSEQEQKAMEEKYTPRIEKIMGKMLPAMMRIAGDESIAEVLGNFLEDPIPSGSSQP